ncbi:MAG TPA: alpha/beta hydrolase [Actinophytocola sp.]|uniref:alpha/beta hydrolase n=1 Tax=Actinophytocola sp. TaxID=1872138 RepID=UPI002DDDAEC0|nr:alpha/beta hydrolase [Actinophytocola sp.]HEV2782502.1 alpha/beta hydrolase [Actinophytocola sp.]
MSKAMSRLPIGIQSAAVRALYALPEPLRRVIAGPPIRIDGNELALDAQLLLRVSRMTETRLTEGTVAQARRNAEAAGGLISGPVIQPVRVRELLIPGDDGAIPARLYTPEGLAEGSPLLVYYHGGGWVICSVDTHDNLCRFLATHAGVRVLSVDYRLAPEHPFPAAPADALRAFEYAARHAGELAVDASAIAVGGDSAGGNLAAVTSYQALRSGGPRPAFQLLIYPGTDMAHRHPSRDLFAEGFFLTDEDITWFLGHYCPEPDRRSDPLASPLLADDLRGLPPTYVATAGFDPLRDEGEAYARRLAEAGVPVVLNRHADLIHGFASFTGVGRRFREALAEAAGALRTGLVLRSHKAADLFGTPPNSPAKAQKERGNPTPGH